MDGADSRAFYAALVYFEKLWIKEGGKKSAQREQMERIGNKPLTLHFLETASYDRFGRLLINGKILNEEKGGCDFGA